jgi:hypothetical protein
LLKANRPKARQPAENRQQWASPWWTDAINEKSVGTLPYGRPVSGLRSVSSPANQKVISDRHRAESVDKEYLLPTPAVTEAEASLDIRMPTLEALARRKWTSRVEINRLLPT